MIYITTILFYITILTKLVLCEITLEDVNDLRIELREEFDASGPAKPLLATTVRLIFHDCSGPQELNGNQTSRCNGCIDYNNFGHEGLREGAINELEDIYNISGWNKKMSRADFWATAATIAIEYAQELDIDSIDTLPSIPYYFGRIDCGNTSAASKTKVFPRPSWGWNDVSLWFSSNLGLNNRETVAIIGAHTLGRAHLRFSGYSDLSWVHPSDGPHILDNQFYINLLSQNWTQSESAVGLWEYKDVTESILMLNTDMSLILDIDPFFDAESFNGGRVTCDTKECPSNDVSIDIVTEYAGSNQLWLTEFVAAFEKLIKTGYNADELTILSESVATDKPIDIISSSQSSTTSTDSVTSTDNPITSSTDSSDESSDDGIITNKDIKVEEEVWGTLNEYSGILSVIAIFGVLVILCIICSPICYKNCCAINRRNQHQSVPDYV